MKLPKPSRRMTWLLIGALILILANLWRWHGAWPGFGHARLAVDLDAGDLRPQLPQTPDAASRRVARNLFRVGNGGEGGAREAGLRVYQARGGSMPAASMAPSSPPPSQGKPAATPPSGRRLVGIAITEQGKHAFVIGLDGRLYTVQPGGQVEGFKVTDVDRDHVYLKQPDGSTQVLSIEKP